MDVITYLTGDAADPWVKGNKVIAHVCNDAGGWGRGFVLSLSKRWPLAETQYRRWFDETHNMPGMEDNPFILGNVQFIPVDHRLDVVKLVDERTFVANMVSQAGFTTQEQRAIRYDMLEWCLIKVASFADPLGASIHMPRIGCGLGGGKWEDVEPIIERTLREHDVYVYDL